MCMPLTEESFTEDFQLGDNNMTRKSRPRKAHVQIYCLFVSLFCSFHVPVIFD